MGAVFDTFSSMSYQSLQMAINGVWLGVALTLLATLFWRAAKTANAATRYAVWWSTLVIVLAVPMIMGISPKLDVLSLGEPGTQPAVALRGLTAETAARGQPTVDPGVPTYRPADPVRVGQLPVLAHEYAAGTTPMDREGIVIQNREPSWPGIIARMLPFGLAVIWLNVIAWLLLRLLMGYRQLVGIKRRSLALDASRQSIVDNLIKTAAPGRYPQVRLSSEVTYPMVAGLGVPYILIPTELARHLTAEEWRTVILHELAHVRRWDDWAKLAQQIVLALAFWHPAVHWINRQLDLEREIAADDQVVLHTGKPDDYALCLTRLVDLTTAGGTSLVPGALFGRKHIFQRFHNLLNREKKGGVWFSLGRFAAVTAGLMLLVALSVQMAPAISLPGRAVQYGELEEAVLSAVTSFSTASAEPERRDEAQPPYLGVAGPVDQHLFCQTGLDDYSQAYHGTAPAAIELPLCPATDIYDDAGVVLDVVSDVSLAILSESEEEPSESRKNAKRVIGTGFVAGDNIIGTWISENDDERTICWSDGRNKLEVRVRGRIEFTKDDRAIKSVSDRGSIEIEEKRGSKRRRLYAEAGREGQLDYEFSVNGRRQDFDEDAEDWLAAVLIDVIRKTGIAAGERTERILAEDGVDGVFDEVSLIESDYVVRLYLDALVAQADLTEDDHARLLKVVRRELESDYEKAEFLINMAPKVSEDSRLMELYVEAVSDIDSDYETRRVLSALSLEEDVGHDVASLVLQIAGEMDSDYEKAELLIDMARYSDPATTLGLAYVTATEDIDSDYEKRRVIEALVNEQELTRDVLIRLLSMAESIDSDYEKAELLFELSRLCHDDLELRSKVIEAAGTLDSDYEMSRVLQSQVYDCDKDQELLMAALKTSLMLESDYEAAEVLLSLARCAGKHSRAREAYLAAVRRFDSDYEMGRVISALVATGDLSDESVLAILEAARGMDSDYETAQVLGKLVGFVRGNDELEDAFLDVVDQMDSDYEADNLLAELYREKRRIRRDSH